MLRKRNKKSKKCIKLSAKLRIYILDTVLIKALSQTTFLISLILVPPLSSLFFIFPSRSISNCNLPLQMCPTLLRMSNAHQLARTLPQSHGTLQHLTAEFPLKVPLKHTQHLMLTSDVSLPGENSSLESTLFIIRRCFWTVFFFFFFLLENAETFFLTTPPHVDAASSRVPDGEEEGWLGQMD